MSVAIPNIKTKNEFLSRLREKLSGLSREDIEKSVDYYSEIIDDKIEDGMSEEEAVNSIGTPDEAAKSILKDMPIIDVVKSTAKAKEKAKGKAKIWAIILIILGFPVWFPILLSILAVIFSAYIAIWSVTLSLLAATVAVVVCAPAALVLAIVRFVGGGIFAGMFFIGAGLILAGLGIFMFFATWLTIKAALFIGKEILLGIKYCIVGKKGAK